MIDSKQLAEYAKHPDLALKHLRDLLSLLDSEDETERECASDLLENGGVPDVREIDYLCEQLKSKMSPRVYWCSTLLGRLGQTVESKAERSRIQAELCKAVEDASLELSARERAVWAISELGSVDETCRAILERHADSAAPRLKRLLETALAS